MKHLLNYLLSISKLKFFVAVSFSIAGAVCLLISIQQISSLTETSIQDLTIIFNIFYWGISGVFFSMVSHALISVLGLQLAKNLRLTCSQAILKLPPRSREKIGSHKIRSMLTQDVSYIADGVAAIPLLIVNSLICTLGVIYLAYENFQMFLIVLIPTLLITMLLIIVKRKMSILFSQVREGLTDVYACYDDLVDGYKELYAYPKLVSYFYHKKLIPAVDIVFQRGKKAQLLWIFGMNYQQLVFFVSISILLIVNALLTSLTSSEVILFIIVLLYLKQPLSVIMYYTPDVMRAANSSKYINNHIVFTEISKISPDSMSTEESIAPIIERLQLDQVAFNYSDDKDGFSLGPINAQFHRGKVHFIIGGNGSGKSTLIKLLSDMYQPDSGRCYCINSKKETKSLSFNDVVVIHSDYYLLKYFNLAEGTPETQIIANLEKLGLDKKVGIIKGEYSTNKLSMGQRRRLALAGLLDSDRSIFIFDEWASDQDPEFRKIFYNDFIRELADRGKIVIVVSHDDRYFDTADCIFRLDSGQISTISSLDKIYDRKC